MEMAKQAERGPSCPSINMYPDCLKTCKLSSCFSKPPRKSITFNETAINEMVREDAPRAIERAKIFAKEHLAEV